MTTQQPISQNVKQNILIIDDNKDFLEIFSMKLKSAGFEVETALGGKLGIALAKEKRPDLILLDVEMPEMNGVETLTALKQDPDVKNTKVIFLTNYGEPHKETSWIDEKFAREAGAIDYIKKSEDLDKIVDEVRRSIKENTN